MRSAANSCKAVYGGGYADDPAGGPVGAVLGALPWALTRSGQERGEGSGARSV